MSNTSCTGQKFENLARSVKDNKSSADRRDRLVRIITAAAM
ncbi:hypothetical protein [Chamaesiphon minutus]|nr:hypothetical protein [Chamaesiphon minutus]